MLNIEEMKTGKIVAVFAICILLTSCMGESGNVVTFGVQPGVVQLQPEKVICIKGGDLITYQGLDKQEDIKEGDCCLVDFKLNFSSKENENADVYTVEMLKYVPVEKLPLYPTLTDTSKVLTHEQVVTPNIKVGAYIGGEFFLYVQYHGYQENQEDSLSLSYNPEQKVVVDGEGLRIYDLYLRAFKIRSGEGGTSNITEPYAFTIKQFVNDAVEKEKEEGQSSVNFRLNYVQGFNNDTTRANWTTSDVYTLYFSGR